MLAWLVSSRTVTRAGSIQPLPVLPGGATVRSRWWPVRLVELTPSLSHATLHLCEVLP